MPTYEYQCEACEHNFDEFQSFSEEALKTCPKCGKDDLRRVFGAGAAVIFKGSGFYETDYRSDSYKKAAKADKEAGSSSSSNEKGSTNPTPPSSKAAESGGKS